jgi:hypothetical protein
LNIFLTLDYEIYFGEEHGTVKKCIIDPTNRLMEISATTGAKMTYFIDIGFIIKLEEAKNHHPALIKDYEAITNQIKRLVASGNDCQLHIHPHWEDCHYDGEKWKINVDRYKLVDFSEEEIAEIVKRYKEKLEELTQKPINSYRAGGWCLQPFSKVKKAFLDNGIKIDSTVYKDGHYESKHYFYDFRNYPNKTRWQFEDKLCEEQEGGSFLQVPISNMTYDPMFFWQLFGWGRLQPKNHKPLGDGYPIATPGQRKKYLTRFTNNPVSLDGYFAKQLGKALKNIEKQNIGNDMVVIGHPKACTRYSLKKLEQFINNSKESHTFKVISEA